MTQQFHLKSQNSTAQANLFSAAQAVISQAKVKLDRNRSLQRNFNNDNFWKEMETSTLQITLSCKFSHGSFYFLMCFVMGPGADLAVDSCQPAVCHRAMLDTISLP